MLGAPLRKAKNRFWWNAILERKDSLGEKKWIDSAIKSEYHQRINLSIVYLV
jgi:hypothetical protein